MLAVAHSKTTTNDGMRSSTPLVGRNLVNTVLRALAVDNEKLVLIKSGPEEERRWFVEALMEQLFYLGSEMPVRMDGGQQTPLQIRQLISSAFGVAHRSPACPAALQRVVEDGLEPANIVVCMNDAHLCSTAVLNSLQLWLSVFNRGETCLRLVLIGDDGNWSAFDEPYLATYRDLGHVYVIPSSDAGPVSPMRPDTNASHESRFVSALPELTMFGGLWHSILGHSSKLSRPSGRRIIFALIIWTIAGGSVSDGSLYKLPVLHGTTEGRIKRYPLVDNNRGPLGSASFSTSGLEGQVTRKRGQVDTPSSPAPHKFRLLHQDAIDDASQRAVILNDKSANADARHASPDLLVLAEDGDTMPGLYQKAYKGVAAPPYDEFVAFNPKPLKRGVIVVFPTPLNGWQPSN